jgi:hypothetical protein
MSAAISLRHSLGSLLRREEAEIYVRRRIATETVGAGARCADRTGHIDSLGIRLITADHRLGTAWSVGFDPDIALPATLELARECALEAGALPQPDDTSSAAASSWLPLKDAHKLVTSHAHSDLQQAVDAGFAATRPDGLVCRAWIDQEHIFSTLGMDVRQQTITDRVDAYLTNPTAIVDRAEPGIGVHLISWDPPTAIRAFAGILARLTPHPARTPPSAVTDMALFIAPPAVALISRILSRDILQNRLPRIQDSASTWSLGDRAERITLDDTPAFDGEGYIRRDATILAHGQLCQPRLAADAQSGGGTPPASASRSDSDALPHPTVHRPYLSCLPSDSRQTQRVWIPDEDGSIILQIHAPTCHIDRHTGELYGEAILGYTTDGAVSLTAERPFRLPLPDYLNTATPVGPPWDVSSGGAVLAHLLRGSPEHLVLP